jgi:NDP-sugar pyrophosphorylase family protein
MRLIMNFATTPVLILAGGKATRLGNISQTIPKALVAVAGRPFIDYQLGRLASHGINKVIMCLGHFADQIRDHVGTGSRYGLSVSYSHDGPTPRGTGGAVRNTLSTIGDGCWVLYGDSLLDVNYREVFEALPAASLGLMTVYRNENRFDSSNVVFQDGRLIKYSKTARTPDMTHIDYGLSLLRAQAIERIPEDRQSDLAELYTSLSISGELAGVEMTRRFYEIGSPAGLQEAEEFLRRAA